MLYKRKPSAHQKQIRRMTLLFGVVAVAIPVLILLVVNRPAGGYHFAAKIPLLCRGN